MCDNLVITILAAGDGKRMNSELPKVLHLFNDKPMLVRIIETALSLNPQKIFIITGKHHKLHRPERKMRQNAVMIYIFYNYVLGSFLNVPL